MGDRIVIANGVELSVEEFGAATGPGILLISGATSSADWWDDEFCAALAEGGGRVVRYDLRDTGRSVTRPLGEADYTGDDLVQDAAGIIRSLALEPAHVVGISFGAGLALQLAIAEPELVGSLTLLSSTPGGPDSDGLPPPSAAMREFLRNPATDPDRRDRDSVFTSVLEAERVFAGDIPVDERRIRRISDRVFDRSIDLAAGANHWSIPSASGTREQLGRIGVPTLVIHGTADPLFPFEHGEALAREIPGARLLAVPGMGHQVPPPETWPLVVPAMREHVASS
jgi:pimeloyl-ACP methyl ester carboxylesterase